MSSSQKSHELVNKVVLGEAATFEGYRQNVDICQLFALELVLLLADEVAACRAWGKLASIPASK